MRATRARAGRPDHAVSPWHAPGTFLTICVGPSSIGWSRFGGPGGTPRPPYWSSSSWYGTLISGSYASRTRCCRSCAAMLSRSGATTYVWSTTYSGITSSAAIPSPHGGVPVNTVGWSRSSSAWSCTSALYCWSGVSSDTSTYGVVGSFVPGVGYSIGPATPGRFQGSVIAGSGWAGVPTSMVYRLPGARRGRLRRRRTCRRGFAGGERRVCQDGACLRPRHHRREVLEQGRAVHQKIPDDDRARQRSCGL